MFMDLVEPLAELAGTKPSGRGKQAGERAAAEASKQETADATSMAGESAPASPSRAAFVEVVATQQITSLEAEPALVREESAAGGWRWRCVGDTEVSLTTADGRTRSRRYGAGTELLVEAGLLHLPPAA